MSPVPSSRPEQQTGFAYSPGDVIAGKYALEQLLGTGGMGAVFRARNTLIDMPVAIKLIRADLDREVLSGRLLQEARAAAKLAHPAIVRVFDVGKTALGDPFIVMELLEGESLANVLEREGRLTSARAVQLLLPIADALSVAHAKGFVHRDVKPDNVFIAVDEDGQLQPKLVDFGIVKHEYASGNSQLTQIGSVVGSPDYMSPEQARGLEGIDPRSDVWSFSVVLYESITGQTPFCSDNYNALLRMIVESEPVSLREQSAADGELSAIVSKGMSKEPASRWGSMGQMGRALAHWLHNQGFTEDACGVSLEARWLSRTTDPAALGRASRSSIPDGWPEPPSGVRTIKGKLGYAPTVHVGKGAGTPVSISQPSGPPARERRLLLGVALGLASVAVALGLFSVLGSRASAPSVPPSSAAAPREATAEAPRPVRPASSPITAATPASAELEAAPSGIASTAPVPLAAEPRSKLKAAPKTQAAPASAPPAAQTTTKAPSDLLAPY